MKRMKKIAALFCAVLMALTLTACGGGKTAATVSVDPDKLAEELLAAVTSDTLTKMGVDPSTVYLYNADDVTSAVVYSSSGATACEVAVIQSKDSSKTGDMETLLKNRVDSQSSLYASYNAGEVEKLDQAIIKSAGAYTVLCVCDDVDKANEVLKNYGF